MSQLELGGEGFVLESVNGSVTSVEPTEVVVHLLRDDSRRVAECGATGPRVIRPHAVARSAELCPACRTARRGGLTADGGQPAAQGVGAGAVVRPTATLEVPGVIGPVELSTAQTVALGAVVAVGVVGGVGLAVRALRGWR